MKTFWNQIKQLSKAVFFGSDVLQFITSSPVKIISVDLEITNCPKHHFCLIVFWIAKPLYLQVSSIKHFSSWNSNLLLECLKPFVHSFFWSSAIQFKPYRIRDVRKNIYSTWAHLGCHSNIFIWSPFLWTSGQERLDSLKSVDYVSARSVLDFLAKTTILVVVKTFQLTNLKLKITYIIYVAVCNETYVPGKRVRQRKPLDRLKCFISLTFGRKFSDVPPKCTTSPDVAPKTLHTTCA